jgi:hypothetical protein
MTPEGKIKAAVNAVLARYPESYVFMSVPYGYGPSTLDYLICHYGKFIAIETKAPGKRPTARQEFIIRQIEGAYGDAFIVDSVAMCHLLQVFMEQVKRDATSSSKSEASDGGGAVRG